MPALSQRCPSQANLLQDEPKNSRDSMKFALRSKHRRILAGVVVLLLPATVAAQQEGYIGCLDARGRLYGLASGGKPSVPCNKIDRAIRFGAEGPPGQRGPQGPPGSPAAAPQVIVETPKDETAWWVLVNLSVQSAFIALSGIIAAMTYSTDSKQRRRTKALELTRDFSIAPEWQKAIRVAMEAAASGQSLTDLPQETRAAIFQVLNQIETIAISTRIGDVDEKMIESVVGLTVVRLWSALGSYVLAERQAYGNRMIWSNFEWLAAHWRR